MRPMTPRLFPVRRCSLILTAFTATAPPEAEFVLTAHSVWRCRAPIEGWPTYSKFISIRQAEATSPGQAITEVITSVLPVRTPARAPLLGLQTSTAVTDLPTWLLPAA